MNDFRRGTPVLDRAGHLTGHTTGSTHHCRMEGCTGRRVTVKWPDGKVTHPCSKGMDHSDSGTLQIK